MVEFPLRRVCPLPISPNLSFQVVRVCRFFKGRSAGAGAQYGILTSLLSPEPKVSLQPETLNPKT